MNLDPISYKVKDRDQLHIQIFYPWQGIIPLFMALVSAVMALRAGFGGQYLFAIFLFVIVAVILAVLFKFVSLRRIELDRRGGTARIVDVWLNRKTVREFRLADIDHLVFTYKQNAESGGPGIDVPPDADDKGNFTIYLGLALSDGEEVRLHAKEGRNMIELGNTLREWLDE